MPVSSKWLRALLFAFIVVVPLTSCKPETPPHKTPQSGAPLSPIATPLTTTALVSPIVMPLATATMVPIPTGPLPTVVLTDCAPGTPIVLQTGKDLVCPTWTPWPTFTPRPTPTRVPGPTPTPVPLLLPAQDAAGSIIYFVQDKTNTASSVYSQLMDAKGAPQHSPNLVSASAASQTAPISPSKTVATALPFPVYFAPDGSRTIGQGAWGVGSVFYINSGKIEPLFRKSINPGGYFLNWGPDSRHVLIRAENVADWDLWLVDSDTGDFITLNNEFHSTGGAISPDGQKVIYAVQKDIFSPGEIWIVDVDGTNAHRLFTTPMAFYDMAWSPDGSKIAFMGDGLMVINADGSNARTICYCGILNNYLFPPVWSPDSRRLAFVANNTKAAESAIMSGDLSAAAIYLVDVEAGKERTVLPSETAGNFDPTWSPDGSQLAFVSMRSGNSEIWVANVDGTNLRQLTNTGQFVRFPYWRRTP